MMQHKKPSKPANTLPTKFGNPRSGLSSRVNYNAVFAILDASTQQDITEILNVVGYRPPPGTLTVPQAQIEAEISRRVNDYLASLDGQQKVVEMKMTLVEHEARRWLDSAEASERLEAACREEIAAAVTEWLESPLGQEALQQARDRAVKEVQDGKSRRKGWIEKALAEQNSAAR